MLQPPLSLHAARARSARVISSWVSISSGLFMIEIGVTSILSNYLDFAHPALVTSFVGLIFIGVVWLLVMLAWITGCRQRKGFNQLEQGQLKVFARWTYSNEEWLEFTEKVFGASSKLTGLQRFSVCFGMCGRHSVYRRMLARKGETIMGPGFIYFNERLTLDSRLDCAVGFNCVNLVQLPSTTAANDHHQNAMNLLEFMNQTPNQAPNRRISKLYVPIPSGVDPESGLEIARKSLDMSLDVLTGANKLDQEKQHHANLTQKMRTLHPPSQRESCRTALSARTRERYMLVVDLVALCVLLTTALVHTDQPHFVLMMLQCVPSAVGLVAFAVVWFASLGHKLAHVVYFGLSVMCVLGAVIAFAFLLRDFVHFTKNRECEGRNLDGWSRLSTLSVCLVVALWSLPFRFSAAATAFVLSHSWQDVIAHDAKLRQAPKHECLERLQRCWMRTIHVFCMPSCVSKDPKTMHASQHAIQLLYECVMLVVNLVILSWVAVLSIGCGLVGAMFGLRGNHYLDVMCNSLAVYFSIILMIFEISKFECEKFESRDEVRLAVNLFFCTFVADSIRLSNLLRSYLESEETHWEAMAEKYVSMQQYGVGPDAPYLPLHEPGGDDEEARNEIPPSFVLAMTEGKSEGNYYPPGRQRSLGSIMDSIGAPPPSEVSSAASSPSRRSLLGASEVAPSSPSGFARTLDGAEAENDQFVSVSRVATSTNAPPPSVASSSPPELSTSRFLPPLESPLEPPLGPAVSEKPSKPAITIPPTTEAPPPSPTTRSPQISATSRSSAQLEHDHAARLPMLSCYSASSSSSCGSPAAHRDPPPSPASTFVGGLTRVPSVPSTILPDDSAPASLSRSPSLRQTSTAAPPNSPRTASPLTVSRNLASFSYAAPPLTSTTDSPRGFMETPPTSTVAPPPSPNSTE